jgi:hypothetical protein
VHHLAGDTRDEGGFTSTPALVVRAKPVPALRRVRMARLCGIAHETGLFLSNHIHARPGGEIVRRLSAAVQHDD